MPPTKNSRKYITATAAAFFTTEPSMRLPQTSASSFLRQTENALRIRTASVVVFIPPAVEPGEPPTSMSRVIIALEEPVIAERSAVLKPAVLGVTD